MKTSLKFFLLPFVFPSASLAQTIGAFNFESAFNFLENGMPDAFEVGQSVWFEFKIDTAAEGIFGDTSSLYSDAVFESKMNVPEASFSAALDPGSLITDSETEEVTISLPGGGESFQGQELISLELVFQRIGGGLPFEELSNSSGFFDEATVSRWSVTFADTSGTSNSSAVNTLISSGVEIGIVPEPGSYALFFGLTMAVLVTSSRHRRQ